MCVCVSSCEPKCTYKNVCACERESVCVCMCVNVYMDTGGGLQVCVCLCVCVCERERESVCENVYRYVLYRRGAPRGDRGCLVVPIGLAKLT